MTVPVKINVRSSPSDLWRTSGDCSNSYAERTVFRHAGLQAVKVVDPFPCFFEKPGALDRPDRHDRSGKINVRQ